MSDTTAVSGQRVAAAGQLLGGLNDQLDDLSGVIAGVLFWLSKRMKRLKHRVAGNAARCRRQFAELDPATFPGL